MIDVDWRTPHLWKKTSPARKVAPVLIGDSVADVAIIGGGFTGLAAALGAHRSGAKVVLLEANEIGSGASGRNNGLLISHHSKARPSEIEFRLGKRRGERYNAIVASASAAAFELLRQLGIDAHAVQNGWIQPAHNAATLQRAKDVHGDWRAFGADVGWLDRTEVRAAIGGGSYLGGWTSNNSGHANPYAMAIGLASALQRSGIEIFENSAAKRLERIQTGWRIHTGSGSVSAREVILATNALTSDLWPGLRQTLLPIKIFEAATQPIPTELRSSILPQNVAVSDMHHDLRFFHYDRDCRLVSGGTLTFWHDEERRGMAIVLRRLIQSFPSLAEKIEINEYWSGVLAAVPDRIPRIYRLAPNIVFAGVYSGRGVALSLSLGQLIGQWVTNTVAEDDLPLPVTQMRRLPFHPFAVTLANVIHPWHRLKDFVGS